MDQNTTKWQVSGIKKIVATLKIQIFSCDFLLADGIRNFARILDEYLKKYEDEERKEYLKLFDSDCFHLRETYYLPIKYARATHVGLELNFNLIIDQKKDTIVDRTGWQSKIIELILDLADTGKLSYTGHPTIVVTDEKGYQFQYNHTKSSPS